MNTRPPSEKSTRRNRQNNLTRALVTFGLYHPGCGIAAIQLLYSLTLRPMTHAERVQTSRKQEGGSCMGVLIRASLAAFNSTTGLYSITQKGRLWLAAINEKGLMPDLPNARTAQEVAA